MQMPPGSANASNRAATLTPSPKMSWGVAYHVAEIDPDAEPDPPLFGHVWLTVGHPALDLDRAAHGIHHARKLCQEAVAGVLHDPAPVFGDLRVDQFAQMRLQTLVRLLLIGAHEPRIACHIGGEDGGETTG